MAKDLKTSFREASTPIFRVCEWIPRDDYEKLREFADYLGRKDGCSLFLIKRSALRSSRLLAIINLLDRLDAKMDNETRQWLEQLAEENNAVYVSLSRRGFVLRSNIYLAELLSSYRSRGLVWYSKSEGGFIVRPFALVDVLNDIRARGYIVRDEAGILGTGKLDLSFNGELRPYQSEALEAWSSNNYRGLIVLPTGAGKTIVALAALASLRVPTLIVVYTREQMMEWYEKIKKFINSSNNIVGLFYSEQKDIKPITIATYQSAYRNLDLLWNKYSLLVIDEAHHLPADKFRTIAIHVMAPYRLGLTATPYREDGRHDELFGLLGGIVYEKSFEELREHGYVANFEVIPKLINLPKSDYEKYRQLRRRYNMLSRGRSVKELVTAAASGDESARRALQILNEMRKLLALNKAKIEEAQTIINNELARGAKIIVFTQYVQQAEELARTLGIPLITGKTDKIRRRITLELFKKGRYRVLVLTTVGDEGIDIPDADVGIVLSGTSSKRQFIQRLGRLLRPTPGKVAKLYYIAFRGTQEENTMKKILNSLDNFL